MMNSSLYLPHAQGPLWHASPDATPVKNNSKLELPLTDWEVRENLRPQR